MAQSLISTQELVGVRVVGGKSGTKRIGKIRNCVFHPKDRKCVGFMVKRPDLLWMFRRRDIFLSIRGYDVVDGRIAIRNEVSSTDKGACKDLGINLDDCVLWVGLPILTKGGKNVGTVGSVVFDRHTGVVDHIEVTAGATANVLLGVKSIPSDLILGFRRGVGTRLRLNNNATEEEEFGAILVAEAAADIQTEGGVAAKAGAATAVVTKKAKDAVNKVKPKAQAVAKTAGDVINAGAYMTGKQISKTKGMFAAFKEEYDKARKEDD